MQGNQQAIRVMKNKAKKGIRHPCTIQCHIQVTHHKPDYNQTPVWSEGLYNSSAS